MNSLPIVLREMRLAARRPWTYWIRSSIALTAVAALLFVFIIGPTASAQKARALLVTLSVVAMALVLLSGVFLTADCLSEEKREGTLGLLFLTTLKSYDVVLGKMAANAASAFFSLLAMLPILWLPLLMGGITWAETVRIILALLLSLALSLSLGLFISGLNTESRKAFVGTLLTLTVFCGIPMLAGSLGDMFLSRPLRDQWISKLSPIYPLIYAFEFNYFAPTRLIPPYWQSVMFLIGIVCALLIATCCMARFSWQHREGDGSSKAKTDETGPAPFQPSRRIRLPRFFAHETDLYCWLSFRGSAFGWGTRLFFGALSVFWLVMLMIAVTTSHWAAAFVTAVFTAFGLHAISKFIFALESTRQIQQDIRSGSMELLLATPLREREIVIGQARAFQRRMNPWLWLLTAINLCLEFAVIAFSEHLHIRFKDGLIFSVFFIGGIIALHLDYRAIQWVGIWQSLKARTHLRATFATIRTILGIPWILFPILFFLAVSSRGRNSQDILIALMLAWCVIGACLDAALIANTKNNLRRRFRELAANRGM